jgi:hypothetical protein
MLKLLPSRSLLLLSLYLISFTGTNAQCPAGFNQVTLNWDYLDYFPYSGNYTSGNGYLSSNTLARTQNFAFGTNRLTISHQYADANSLGENGTHTAAAGDDIQFIGNNPAGVPITFSFATAVRNVRFFIYDIDRSQRIQFAATDGATARVIDLTETSATLSLTNDNTTTARVTANSTTVANTSGGGTVQVDIVGPVTSFSLTVTASATCSSSCGAGGNEDGSFWISDITACSAGNFANNYYNVSRPFTGQPGYVLHALDRSVYAVNPATGVTKLLFTDNLAPFGGTSNVNSMAYDPYNRILYYVYSLSSNPAGNRRLKKYDFNTETISDVVADLNSIGIPTTTYAGVESGAATFYNGTLYLGIETSNSGNNSGREATIWRVDFNASNIPYRASQVFALPVDNGGNLLFDWGDFVINNGMLYNFDQAGVTTETDIYHFNLLTGGATNNSSPTFTPAQPGIDWNGNIYQMYAVNRSGTSSDIAAHIALYNTVTGNIGATTNLTSTPAIPFPDPPSLGDAGEAYRPLCDFGDAPATYDPVALSPAVNERDPALRIGAAFDREWNKTSSALADADGTDEDGVGTVTIFNSTLSTYQVQVSVFNNTGANARLIGWLDYNGDGDFDTGEASAVATVATGASAQNISLSWTGIFSSLATGSYTYLRIRLASASLGMTSANATGWFNNGETEDYRVIVDNVVLPLTLLSFDAKALNNSKVKLTWSASEDNNSVGYEIQHSPDGRDWEYVAFVSASQSGGTHQYEMVDNNPYKGTSRYRLRLTELSSQSRYSEVRIVKITDLSALITISPNPATSKATVTIANAVSGDIARIRVMDATGNQLSYQKIPLTTGNNMVELPVNSSWPSSTYLVLVSTNEGTINKKLILRK